MATPDLLTTRTHAVIGVIHGYPVSVLWIILAGGLGDFGASCHRPVPHLALEDRNNGSPHVEARVSLAARGAKPSRTHPQDDQTSSTQAPGNPIGGLFLPLAFPDVAGAGNRELLKRRHEERNSLRGFWEGRKSARLVVKVGRFPDSSQLLLRRLRAGWMQARIQHADAGCRNPSSPVRKGFPKRSPASTERTEERNAAMAGKRRHLRHCSQVLLHH